MRVLLVTSLALALLGSTGCSLAGSADAARRGTMPASADVSDDPAWCPPEEVSIEMRDERVTHASGHVASRLPTPNRRPVLAGQLHAAN